MKKYLLWFRLNLKRQLKNWTFWVQFFSVIFMLVLMRMISLPANEDTTVSIFSADKEEGAAFLETLKKSDSVFHYREEESAAVLEEHVRAGKSICGFEIGEDFTKRLQKDDTFGLITYVCASVSAKGSTARESFYAAFYRLYAERLLNGSLAEIYGADAGAVSGKIMAKAEALRNSASVFSVRYETVGNSTAAGQEKKAVPLRGLSGLFLFMCLFFVRGEELHAGKKDFSFTLSVEERKRYRLIRYFSDTVLLAAAIGAVLVTGLPFISGCKELLLFTCFYLACCLWVFIFGRLFKNEVTCASSMLTLLAVNLAVCPVFFEMADFVPVLRAVRLFFPLGQYLEAARMIL